ncbi:MAG: transcription elongation factor GreA [Candidatus Berkelbacteria bacterium]|nr:transcription elongation factor GreA [Candidatus Berkelbacteria bacterium]
MYLTFKGLEKLKSELLSLKGRRKEVAERIKVAREFGDLSENSEYEDARNEQSFLEGRIQESEDMIRKAVILEKNGNGGDKAELGSVVTLQMDGEKLTYELVGATESDPINGKISVESPLGFCLMGKKKSENVEIKTPNGKTTYKIITIK